jgi:transposase
LSWLENGCAVLPAPDQEWLNRGLLIPQVGLPSRCVPARPRGVEDQATVLHLLTKRREDLVAARTPDHQPAAPGEVGDVGRFPTTHHFAAHTGTAPLEASSGQVVRHRLSRAGDRKLHYALYMMAMVQVRRPSAGQVYYRRKLAEGKSPKEALWCLKRRLSDAVYRCGWRC